MHDPAPQKQAAIQTDLSAIFVSLEFSQANWLITSLSPGGGEKMSKHSMPAADIAGLLWQFARRASVGGLGRELMGRL